MATHAVPMIDGFTPEQQFFMMWASSRGEAMRVETHRQIVKGDSHAMPKFRVIGPRSNLPEFEQALSCKAGATRVRPLQAAPRCVVAREIGRCDAKLVLACVSNNT